MKKTGGYRLRDGTYHRCRACGRPIWANLFRLGYTVCAAHALCAALDGLPDWRHGHDVLPHIHEPTREAVAKWCGA